MYQIYYFSKKLLVRLDKKYNLFPSVETDIEEESRDDASILNDEIVEKMRRSESISFQTKIYGFLAFYFMMTSLCFFVGKERSAKLSPSQSRQKNAECTFMIFDNHDIWHFTSAFGILFTSLALLTLEDKNTDTPWENIRVF